MPKSDFDVKHAVRASKDALDRQDHEMVHTLLQQNAEAGGAISPSLIVYAMRAMAVDKGADAAWPILEQFASKITASQYQNAAETVALFCAGLALKQNNPRAALDLIKPYETWLKEVRHLAAAKIQVQADLMLGRTPNVDFAALQQNLGDSDNADPGKILGTLLKVAGAAQRATKASPPPRRPDPRPVPAIFSRSILWTKDQLLTQFPELKQISGPEFMRPIESVSFHQQSMGPGSLMIPAIKAATLEGTTPGRSAEEQARIVTNALFAGASAAIVDQVDDQAYPEYAPVFRCDDRNQLFVKMAQIGRQRLRGDVIGITGSFGKTTTRELISQMLGLSHPTSTQYDNRNALSGICETLASTADHLQDCVLEQGISIPNTMLELTNVAQPDIPILLSVVDSHLGNYPDQKALLTEKFQIFDGATGKYPALISRDTLDLDQKLGTDHISKLTLDHLSVGKDAGDDIQLIAYAPTPFGGTASIRVLSQTLKVHIPTAGPQLAHAACYALGVAHLKGMDLEEAARNIMCYRPIEAQRGTRWHLSLRYKQAIVEVIDDSQNASPETTRSLLGHLAGRTPKRRVLIMGDMLELGKESRQKHVDLAEHIRAAKIDLLFTVGEDSKALHDALAPTLKAAHFRSITEARAAIPARINHGDLIALKGSALMEIGRMRGALAAPEHQQLLRSAWRIENEG